MSSVGIMPRGWRKLALTAHVTCSVGWMGAVAASLALALAGLTGHHAPTVQGVYVAMDVIARLILVPLGLASLVTGLISSLGTKWGLFRHYWVVTKLVLTLLAVIVLIMKLGDIEYLAGVSADGRLFESDLREMRKSMVVHSAGGLLILLTNTVLAVFKPAGLTRYGRRKASEDDARVLASRSWTTRRKWTVLVLATIIGLLLLILAVHRLGGGLRPH